MTQEEYETALASQDERLRDLDQSPTTSDALASAVRDPKFLWRDNTMPYYIDNSFTAAEKKMILAGMGDLEAKTCLRFRPVDGDLDYVHIHQGSGCSSQVGRTGGRQYLSLRVGKPGRRTCMGHKTIVHELVHAAGFFHEQSRFDRDKFVNINIDNVWPGNRHNFDKQSSQKTKLLGSYDYSSIMHYHEYAFTKNTKKTIVKKQGRGPLGNNKGLTAQDVSKINQLYGCHVKDAKTRSVTGTLESERVTNWGTWAGNFSYCGGDSLAQGFDVLVQPFQGSGVCDGADDTGLSGVSLFCRSWDERCQADPDVYGSNPSSEFVAFTEDWGATSFCRPGHFLNAFQLRVEEKQGGKDDMSATDIKFRCTDGSWIESGEAAAYGDWQATQSCPKGSAICALQTQVEDDQGDCEGSNKKDDTGLNNVNFKCCKLNPGPVAFGSC